MPARRSIWTFSECLLPKGGWSALPPAGQKEIRRTHQEKRRQSAPIRNMGAPLAASGRARTALRFQSSYSSSWCHDAMTKGGQFLLVGQFEIRGKKRGQTLISVWQIAV